MTRPNWTKVSPLARRTVSLAACLGWLWLAGAPPAQTAQTPSGAPATPARPPTKTLTPEEKRFLEARSKALQEAGIAEAKTMAARAVVMEKAARTLQKEFPTNEGVDVLLLQAAGYLDVEKGRALAQEIADKAPSESLKSRAQTLIQKFDRVGKPLDLQFTAVDGRKVDLSQMKGKVVLVDFWATWCGPCVVEVPNVVRAYEKLHPKGFEIIGLSFDRDNAKAKLEQFVAEKKMPWPQYFDGKFWDNAFGRQFGIDSIPSMWLVDKKGILRDLNARGDLEAKVEKLLAE